MVPLVTKGRDDGTNGTNLDLNYFLGLSGNVLAADFEEGAAGPVPGLNHPLTGTTRDCAQHRGTTPRSPTTA